MIDIKEIKTGDCLAKLEVLKSKLCFVLFPYMEYNVCIRHEYEFSTRSIRLTHYQPIAPSDLKNYDYMPVATFKKLAHCFSDAIRLALQIVTSASKSDTSFPNEESCQLYKLITGDYVAMPPNGAVSETNPCITISSGELATSDKPLQDWQTGGAEVQYISKATYEKLKEYYNDSRKHLHLSLLQALMEYRKNKTGKYSPCL